MRNCQTLEVNDSSVNFFFNTLKIPAEALFILKVLISMWTSPVIIKISTIMDRASCHELKCLSQKFTSS